MSFFYYITFIDVKVSNSVIISRTSVHRSRVCNKPVLQRIEIVLKNESKVCGYSSVKYDTVALSAGHAPAPLFLLECSVRSVLLF